MVFSLLINIQTIDDPKALLDTRRKQMTVFEYEHVDEDSKMDKYNYICGCST